MPAHTFEASSSGMLKALLSLLCLFGVSVALAGGFQRDFQHGFQQQRAPTQYEAGKHYAVLDIPVRRRDPKTVEVTEYFSYTCGHCFTLEPLINQWHSGLPEGVKFTRTPAIWSDLLEFYAQVYYTAEALGVLDKMHVSIFRALHVERRRLDTPEAMAAFFSEQDIDTTDFMRTFNSFGVKTSLQQAYARGRAYRASSTPTIIVNGKYRIGGTMVKSHPEMLNVADMLIQRDLEQVLNQSATP